MLGIIRVLTTDDKTRLNEHGDRLRELYNIQTISHCIEGQPQGVYDASSMSVAIPKIVRLAHQMVADYPLKALTISCASDPGLKELRNVLKIPVFAAGACSANVSLVYGQTIGVIGITEQIPSNIKNIIGDRLLAYAYAKDYRKTTSLADGNAKLELLAIAKQLVDKGADTILLACTGFSTIRLKAYLNDQLKVPIIDPVEAQGITYRLLTST